MGQLLFAGALLPARLQEREKPHKAELSLCHMAQLSLCWIQLSAFFAAQKIFACFWVLAAMPEGPALLQGFPKLWQFFLMAVLPQSWQPPGWVPLLCFGAESSWERELAAPLCCPKPRAEFPSLVSGCSEGFPSPSSPCGAPSWQRPAVPQGRCAKGFQCARALSLHSPCPCTALVPEG